MDTTHRPTAAPGRRAVLAGTAALLAAAASPDARAAAPVRMGRIGLSFYAVSAAVASRVLERLGHAVEARDGSHPAIYPMLGTGEIDVMVAAWLPHAHARLHAPVADRVVEAATLYDGARLFLAVPDHAPASIRAVADLARPEVAAAAERTIVGVAPGSGSALGAEAMLDAYGLRAAGWSLRIDGADAWSAAIRRGLEARVLFAAPLWTPLWTDRAFPMRPLDDPLRVYGGEDRAVILVRRETWNGWPDRTRRVVSRIALGRPAVAAMDEAVVRGGMTAVAAADAWMQDNRSVVEGWFA